MRAPDVYVIPAPAIAAPHNHEPLEVKGKEPDTFDGTNRDLYPAFILQLALLFNNNHKRYVDDMYKIRAAGSYL